MGIVHVFKILVSIYTYIVLVQFNGKISYRSKISFIKLKIFGLKACIFVSRTRN